MKALMMESIAEAARTRAQVIEAHLEAAVAEKHDLAVVEEWDGLTLVLSFAFVAPGVTPPPNCTLYKASEYEPRGRK